MQNSTIHISQLKHIYFIGIGGIGMSAVARYFHHQGVKISGYDRVETELTLQLVSEGIDIHYVDDMALAPKDVDLVIYTPAIPKNHSELNFYIDHQYNVIKRSDALSVITESSFNICVAGTHGKTTTTTMLAHLLRDSGYGCNAFLGGISANYNTNFWSNKKNVCVIEADEYDRTFLKLSPDIAVVTSADPDHLDIYETAENFIEAFELFTGKVKTGGILYKKLGVNVQPKTSRVLYYSLEDKRADIYATRIQLNDGGYSFDLNINGYLMQNIHLNMGGLHNVENMIVAISIAKHLEIDDEKIKSAVANFRGVKRRFEYIIKRNDMVLIDDYAHHPEELKSLINGVKSLFFEKKTTVIFQPHLYSRSKDFMNEFAAVLDMADQVILLPIYPARELPMPGVESHIIANKMKAGKVKVLTKEALMEWMHNDYVKNYNQEKGEILVIAGAGDINNLIEPIKQVLIK
ncbi:MAG: UDP-N-acetylmuramate--L-alanine ligase [Chitinophagaceae bacterium]|nr:MAG: UDP-N-acetylmuramate--L-alanine ligase [Chitinophagaceae bacterium]